MPEPFVVDFAAVESAADLGLAIGCSGALIAKIVELNDGGGPKPWFVIDEIEEAPIVPLVILDPKAYNPYFKRYLPRKNRRKGVAGRLVWVIAHTELANAQKSLARRLDLYLRQRQPGFPSASVHGYVRDRSIVTNAAPHVGARLLLNADIRDFFPTITSARIARSLQAAGMTSQGAQLLARFTTIGGQLPLGFNASPLLANLVCVGLDERLERLAATRGCTYTRYADDFTISGAFSVPCEEEIAAELEAEGFSLAQEKFRTSKNGQRHFVTGLSVSDSSFPRLPKRLKRRLRQELYFCGKFGIESHFERNRRVSSMTKLDGRIAYALGAEPAAGEKLAARWRVLLAAEDARVIYPPRPERAPHDLMLLFDESVIESATGPVMSMCCVVLDDPDGVRAQLQLLQRQYLADPFASGRKAKLQKRGFHYADDAEETRTAVIKLLSELPLRALVSYGIPPAEIAYERAYMSLFWGLTRDRFFAADRRRVAATYEENPQVKHEAMERVVRELYESMERLGTRRPIEQPTLRRAGKIAEPLLALPDYFLGVFGGFALRETRPGRTELVTRRFERLRDRFRLILALNQDIWYSRRRPFEPWVGGDPAASREE